MALTVSTIAASTRLTTVARVKSELGITASTDDTLIGDLVDRASAAVVSYCHRPFAREVYSETLPGFGDIHLQLARTPLVGSPSSVTFDSNTITDYSVADAEQGWLYRRAGWGSTTQRYPGLMGFGAWLDHGWPMPMQDEPSYTVAYTAGYILPSENYTAITISADSADNSFNDTASGFPALLKAGDIITVSGFTGAGATAANKRHVVSGTPTTAKIVVTSTLVSDAAGESVTVVSQTLPADIEKACIETVKHFYLTRRDDSNVVEKQVGAMRLRYSESDEAQLLGIPAAAIGLLRPWVRAA